MNKQKLASSSTHLDIPMEELFSKPRTKFDKDAKVHLPNCHFIGMDRFEMDNKHIGLGLDLPLK